MPTHAPKAKKAKSLRKPYVRKKGAGRPPHVPTEQTRSLVALLAATRVYNQHEIAAAVGCNDDTLRKYYSAELDHTNAKVDAQVMQALIYQAGGNGKPEKADPATTRFYAVNRLNFKEQRNVKHSGAVGAFDMSKLTDEELDRFEELANRVSVPSDVSRGES